MANNDEEAVVGETIFGRMLTGQEPSKFIYEDEQCVAFDDINPTAPVHFLVIPRKPIRQLADATEEDQLLLGHLLLVGNRIAREQKRMAADGYRVVINSGHNGFQTIYHLHLHFIGGRPLGWPFG
ncbi:hypothetical protein TYRP_018156 [Tyrophagus putrescentiae]|nr:hypothetical protein TYRP_018156 [Tyrophagus putrescentiae]